MPWCWINPWIIGKVIRDLKSDWGCIVWVTLNHWVANRAYYVWYFRELNTFNLRKGMYIFVALCNSDGRFAVVGCCCCCCWSIQLLDSSAIQVFGYPTAIFLPYVWATSRVNESERKTEWRKKPGCNGEEMVDIGQNEAIWQQLANKEPQPERRDFLRGRNWMVLLKFRWSLGKKLIYARRWVQKLMSYA